MKPYPPCTCTASRAHATAISLAYSLAMDASALYGRPWSFNHAARRYPRRAVSTATRMSAILNWSASKDPMGRPKASRSPAYFTLSSRHPRARPTASAAKAMRPSSMTSRNWAYPRPASPSRSLRGTLRPSNESSRGGRRVPRTNLLGEAGRGYAQFLEVIDDGRIAFAALAVGLARGCLEESVKYAGEREAFGRPIGSFEALQFKMADMRVAVETARLGYLRAAWLKDHGRPYKAEASIAKLYASEMAVACAREAVQVHGGYGFIEEFPVARFYRDAKVLEIGEGTSEIQRLLIARDLGLPGTEL